MFWEADSKGGVSHHCPGHHHQSQARVVFQRQKRHAYHCPQAVSVLPKAGWEMWPSSFSLLGDHHPWQRVGLSQSPGMLSYKRNKELPTLQGADLGGRKVFFGLSLIYLHVLICLECITYLSVCVKVNLPQYY